MSDLTKRLPDRLRVHYNMTADDIAEEAADRIEALEECLRYYADTKNWARTVTYVTNGDVMHKTRGLCEMDCDRGSKARALLEEK